MLSPESLPVPPTGSFWGGAESLVWDLSVVLGEMNHEVTLVARPSSKSPPNGFLVETFRDENDPPSHPQWGAIERHHYYYENFVKNFEGVVHDHSNGKLAWRINSRTLSTPHWCQDPRAMGYKNITAASHAQAKWLNDHSPSTRNIPVVHHGIDCRRFTFNSERKDFYLFFSVIARYKGAEKALLLAKETGCRMVFAGRNGDMSDIIKNCGLTNVRYLGEVSNEQRISLFSEAKALVFPTGAWGDADPPNWLEIFGLVQLEALASGCPVIASNNGACPEVIEDFKVGFVCPNYQEMKYVIENDEVEDVKPETCRQYIEEKFSAKRMANDYVKLYKKIVEGDW